METLEGRVMLHAGHEHLEYLVGSMVPWLSAPVTSAPATPPPPVSPPVSPPPPPATAVGSVSGLTVVDAGSDGDLRALTSGDTLDRNLASYSVRANVTGEVGSVQFLLNGTPIRTETSAPYTIAGDDAGDYYAWDVPAGDHTLTVVPYAGAGATGEAGTPFNVTFSVTAPAVPPPTVPPPPTSGSGFTKINWTTKAPSPIVRAEALSAKYNDRLYVFGGFSGKRGPVTDSHYYDPATDTWTAIKPLPQPITHAGVAQDAENVYFVGAYVGNGKGYGQVFGSEKVWKYNFATDTYTELTNLPKPLAGGSSAIVDGKLHYFGGYNLDRTDTNIHLVLDLANPAGGWKNLAPMLLSRNHMGSAVMNGKIYAIAGQTGTDAGLVTKSNVEMYDPATNTWTVMAPMPKPASHILSATFVMGDRILVMGGESAHNVQVRDVFAYTPATNTWQTLTPLPAPKFSGVANVINGKIYFTTGGGGTTTWEGTPA